jgi:hypothetical protein
VRHAARQPSHSSRRCDCASCCSSCLRCVISCTMPIRCRARAPAVPLDLPAPSIQTSSPSERRARCSIETPRRTDRGLHLPKAPAWSASQRVDELRPVTKGAPNSATPNMSRARATTDTIRSDLPLPCTESRSRQRAPQRIAFNLVSRGANARGSAIGKREARMRA